MEEIIDFVNFEIQNSGYAEKLAAGVVITGGGSMLKHLPQLMKFKTAMDVRLGLPNEHLAGSSRNEINQPMFATSVGLIMKGFEYLDTYKQKINIGPKNEYVVPEVGIAGETETDGDSESDEYQPVQKTSLAEKIRLAMQKMFEVEDQPIN